jgi:hypothetical protein
MSLAFLALHGYVQVQGFTTTAAAGTAGQAQSIAHPPKLRHAFLQVGVLLSRYDVRGLRCIFCAQHMMRVMRSLLLSGLTTAAVGRGMPASVEHAASIPAAYS